jgi:hypothetical protein
MKGGGTEPNNKQILDGTFGWPTERGAKSTVASNCERAATDGHFATADIAYANRHV